MTFKPAVWFPISVVLALVNLAGVGFAAQSAEPWHAGTHAALAVGFGLWAQSLRLRRTRGRNEFQTTLEALETEMIKLREELSETQERMDFAERMLAQGQDPRRVGPEP